MNNPLFKGVCNVVKPVNKLNKIMKAIEELSKKEVLIGIPKERASREKEKINNAELGYIHSFGSALKNIPPRPFLEPSIKEPEVRLKIISELDKATREAMNGNSIASDLHLKRAGIIGSTAAKEWFTNPKNNWAELKPATISARLRKFKKSHSSKYKQMVASGEEFEVMPLIDTGQLRRAITYVIREKT